MQTPTTSQVRRYYQAGFTLIELLIVIAIIGILAAIAVPQYGAYLDRSARSACVSELSSFRSIAIAESATTGAGTVSAENEIVTGYNFESCTVTDDAAKVALANNFISGGSQEVAVNRENVASINIADGQITTTAAE